MAVVWCTHIFAEVSLTTKLGRSSRGPARVFPLCWARTLPPQLGSSRLVLHRHWQSSPATRQAPGLDNGLRVTARDLGCVSEEPRPPIRGPGQSAPRPRRSRGVAALRLGPWVRQSSAPRSMHFLRYVFQRASAPSKRVASVTDCHMPRSDHERDVRYNLGPKQDEARLRAYSARQRDS